VEAGLVESLQEAFVQYIANDAPAYVPKNHTPPEEIVRLVHGAGGVCVLAHPGRHVSLNAVDRLLAAGIDGIETVHPSHDEDLERYYGDLARRYGLIQTGGSDYHGFRDEEEMRFGSYGVPYEHVAHALRRAA
jgi:3',5'-nucleoside bisphosphate phosphatase